LGVPENLAKAVEWYSKAAEQGDVDAQYKLGQMYYYGDGVGADFSKAVEWYTRAAEQGHEKAKAKIAELSK
jgi:hypothetical protein